MIHKPPYKDNSGRWRTQSLFKEFYVPHRESWPPVFTLKEYDETQEDGTILLSMRQLFLGYSDPTGYAFSKEILHSYEHWRKLCSCLWFKEHIAAWNEELEVKLISSGLLKLKDIAKGVDGAALKASTYLMEKGWEPKMSRPVKENADKQARISAGVEAEVEDDLQRIRLVV